MQKILLDSNILIYSLMPEHSQLLALIDTFDIYVSAITKVEVLGYHRLSIADKTWYENFFQNITIFEMSETVINQAIALKQQKKMSLGDSIIASTALLQGLPLMTRNIGDFAWISGLQLIDPFDE